jgi:hypothetical protein
VPKGPTWLCRHFRYWRPAEYIRWPHGSWGLALRRRWLINTAGRIRRPGFSFTTAVRASGFDLRNVRNSEVEDTPEPWPRTLGH